MKKLDIKNDWTVNIIIICCVILLAFFLSALAGCMTPKKINKFKELYCKDSISVVIKDRIVKVPVNITDSSSLDLWLECDSIGQVYYKNWQYIKGQYTALKVQLDKNKMQITGTAIIHDTVDRIVTDTIIKSQTKIVKNELTKAQQTRQAWFWYFLIEHILLILLILTYTFFKFKTKILAFFKKP